MIRMIAFDLDDTLAKISKPIDNSIIEYLKLIESNGIKIAICSGKPIYYLCGMMRQVGLKNPILVGENGICIQYGIDLPPIFSKKFYFDKENIEFLDYLRTDIIKVFPWVWLQPNEIALTAFFRTDEEKTSLLNYFNSKLDNRDDMFSFFIHSDSFDLMPKFNKGCALEFLMSDLNINANEIIAVGDGENDYPMFSVAKYSIGINLKNTDMAKINVSSIYGAFQEIDRINKLNEL